MSQEKTYEIVKDERVKANWRSLYRLAGVGVILGMVLMLVDIGLSFAGGDIEVGALSVQEWFALYQRSWFMGMRNLGFFNVISFTLSIPLYLALYRLHRNAALSYATLALVLFLFGAAIYNGNNRALAMLTLSNQYASAPTEAEKTLLAAAGTVVLAQAEDFTPGTFLGLLLTSMGSIAMMAVMLTGSVFGKHIALVGLVGQSGLLVFAICVTFIPASMSLAMIPALIGWLLMMAWNITMTVAMFRLGRPAAGYNKSLTVLAS